MKRTRATEGVVTLLDRMHSRKVEHLWDTVEEETGLSGVRITPYPHFSYLVADRLLRRELSPLLTKLATGAAPFQVRVHGVATFGAPWPVVYLRVEPDASLRAFQQQVWDAAVPATEKAWPYYAPDQWVPHVTLAHGEEPTQRPLTPEEVAEVVRIVSRIPVDWTVTVDHLALIIDQDGRQELGDRFPFEGRRT